MKVELDIEYILLVTGQGADHISLQTMLPDAVYPFEGKQELSFKAAAGTGEAYCHAHFPGIPVKIVGIPKHEHSFSGRKEA